MMKKVLFILLSLVITASAFAQNATIREHKTKKDSLPEYPYVFPILGKKATAKGFQLPLPHGVMVNFLAGRQKLAIEDMKVGFNNNGLIDVSNIINFGPSEGTIYTANVRVDTWILPFLNVGGYYGQGESKATVRLEEPFELVTEPISKATYYGLSALLAGGYKGLFNKGFMLSWDLNASWTTNENLDKPVFVAISGLRTGPIFPLKKPNSNIVVWTGAAYTYVAAETIGSIGGADIFPGAAESIQEKQDNLDNWYMEQGSPAEGPIKNLYDGLSGVLTDVSNNIDDSSIQYSMTKKALGPVNWVLGFQYQMNLHWQLRLEGQMLGGRSSGLVSLNYRFGI
jgi:hypothetical protein